MRPARLRQCRRRARRDRVSHGLSRPRGVGCVDYPHIMSTFRTIDELEVALQAADYLPDRGLSTALFLSLALEKPLLLEGEAGVGKTEAAKALAVATGARLIRLQCYEGLDVAHAVYEWNYPRQLLHIRLRRREPSPRTSSSAPNSSSAARCSRRSTPTSRSCC